jgi:hypothetical protein
MARRAMKAEKAKMMDSAVLEKVRVWKSSITHELHVQPMIARERPPDCRENRAVAW